MKKGLDIYRCLAVFAAGMALVASGAAEAADRPDIAIAVTTFPRTLAPAENTSAPELRILDSIFDSLIRFDFNHPLPGGGARLVPGLAESWSWTTPRTLDIKLRRGVVCHDGNPFNADDVLATFSPGRLWGPKSYYPYGFQYFNMIANVEKLDDNTVRFTLNRDDPAFEQRLTSSYSASYIICDEAWNKYRKPGVADASWMDEAAKATRFHPVGTGPYKFVDAFNNDRVMLVANDAYWEGKPAAAKITFRIVPEVAARVAGLIAGDYDMAVQIPPDQWDSLDGYKDITLDTVSLAISQVVVFNENDPLLKDKNLRQALSYSIDRKALNDDFWKGRAIVPAGHQHPDYGDMYVTDRQGKGYPTDLQKAKELLAKSNYKGQEISFRVVPNFYQYDLQSAQILQEMWRKIGINIRIDFFDSYATMRTKPGVGMYIWQNPHTIPDPTGQMMILWGPGTAIQDGYHFFNAPAEFNELSGRVANTLDLKQRQRDWGRMLDIFEDDMPMTLLFMPADGYGMKKTIRWNPYSGYAMDFRPANFSIEKK